MLNLDECQFVKGQMVECTRLTLMRRELVGKGLEFEETTKLVGRRRQRQDSYGVQSKKNIW